MYDVVIVGYGPTGMLAAVKLGRAGHRLRSSSATTTLYMLPRVGIVHDDVLRMFQEIGIVEKIAPATYFLPTYEMSNQGKILLSNTWSRGHAWLAGIHLDLPAGFRGRARCCREEPAERRSFCRGRRPSACAGRRQGHVTAENEEGVRRRSRGALPSARRR